MSTLNVQKIPTVIDEVHVWDEARQARVRELLSDQGARRVAIGTAPLDDAVVRGEGDR